MKRFIILATAALAFAACNPRVSTGPAEKEVEKNTTVINPPAGAEKKVEKDTTVVHPPGGPAIEEKKTETTR